ncbi:MAG: chorismate-binding protein, partial [Clostridium sp.]
MIKEIKTNLNPLEVYESLDYIKDKALLDSSKEDRELSRYSFIGVNSFITFSSKGNDITINNNKLIGNPFKELQKLINKYKYEKVGNFPLESGAIGYFSYDIGRIIESVPNTSSEDFSIPDCIFKFYDNIIIFDLIGKRTFITARGILDDENISIEKLEKLIYKGKKINEDVLEESDVSFEANFTKENYIKAIKSVKEYIKSGDVYIANMTQRFKCKNNKKSIELYRKLRTINKAPFSALLEFDDFQIISSSPERFIEVREGMIKTSPIKGTRRRGETDEEDEALKR